MSLYAAVFYLSKAKVPLFIIAAEAFSPRSILTNRIIIIIVPKQAWTGKSALKSNLGTLGFLGARGPPLKLQQGHS